MKKINLSQPLDEVVIAYYRCSDNRSILDDIGCSLKDCVDKNPRVTAYLIMPLLWGTLHR